MRNSAPTFVKLRSAGTLAGRRPALTAAARFTNIALVAVSALLGPSGLLQGRPPAPAS